MAKKDNIPNMKAPDVLKNNFMPYAMSVIMSRAIPEIDGLKPSHRKLLYTMYEMGLLSGGRTKSANVAARTMLLNPHGDCLRGDTIFEDLAGNRYTIKDLCEQNIKGLECLSIDTETQKIERTKLTDFRIGQYAKTIYKITLQNGFVIEATSNHPFLCKTDKGIEYIKAENLKEGCVLFSETITEDKNGYYYVKRTPLHRIINDIPKDKVLHHKDGNPKNNLKSNSAILSRKEHALIHEDYKKGLEKGRISLFSENGSYRESTREKNNCLMVSYNKVQPVLRFYKVIDWMLQNDIKINELTYSQARVDSGVYRAPYIEHLIKNGYATSMDDLLSKRSYYESYVRNSYTKKENNDNCKNNSSIIDNSRFVKTAAFGRSFIVFDEMHRQNMQLSFENYLNLRKLLSNERKVSKYRLTPVFQNEQLFLEALNSYYEKNVIIKKIEKIELDSSEAMYDFTSSNNNNVLLPVNNNLWICVHNSAIYETAVRFTQNNETLLTPLIDGKGNFGKHYSRDTSYAASRYTEMKLMPVATEFFKSIKKDTVDFVDNYDSTRKEPTLLPVTFPNILANPTEGIAVGMASSIPSFNLSELCEATIMRIQHPKNDIKTVMPAPDFTTGAELLLNSDVIDDIYKTGKGSIILRSKYTVDEKKRIIEVNEIPYSTTAEAIIEGIISLIKSNKITEISDIRNEIGLHGFRIAIDYKRGVDPKNLMMKLFRISKLQDSYSCNMTILINGKPRTAGVVEILDEWIKWRRVCVTRELVFDLNKKKNELHLLEGLAKVLLDIDKAIKIIKGTEDDVDVVPALMKGFDLTEAQAEYVSEIKLRNLNKNYILNKTKNIETLKDEIDDLQNKINSEKEIDKIIIKTLKEVQKKYGIPRKTEILTSFENVNSTSAVNVPDYPVKVFVTKEGYVKKVALTSIKNDPEIKFKDGDEVINIFESSNSKELLVFTNKANVYKVNLSELKDSKPSELPDIIYNYCEFEAGERDLYICTSDAGKSILIGYENGKVSKVPLSAYETKQNRKKLTNGYGTVSQPIGFFATDDDTDYTMESDKGKLLVFNCDKVPLKTTKSTQGVQVLRLTKDAKAIKLGKPEDYEIKSIDDYRSANIPGSGKVKP